MVALVINVVALVINVVALVINMVALVININNNSKNFYSQNREKETKLFKRPKQTFRSQHEPKKLE